jgi:hypothetical protein
MRLLCLFLLFSVSVLNIQPARPQQSSASIPNPSILLQQSLAAISGSQTITDISLSGSVRRIAGSDDETGTGVLKAISGGAGRADLSLPLGRRSEIINTSITPPVGSWSGPDGASHSMAFHNILTGATWFFPAFAIAQGLSASGYVATYIGPETHNGQAVQHISLHQSAPLPNPPGGATFEHLTQVDFFLDSTTLLPSAIDFNIHPDNNALLDIPVEVQFSDYRAVNGAQIPYHVQKYLNNSLILDFQSQTVTFNTGLAASTFAAQ